jgi:uncharacterized protein
VTTHSIRPTVLITGASAGIGSELVPYFAGTGHNVVLVARQEAVLQGIAAAVRNVFRVDTCVIACDLAQPDAARTIVAELTRRNIHVDILVNNAGIGAYGEFAETPIETAERIVQVNILALTALTRLLLPGMIARRSGKILNVASTAAFAPIPMHSVYGASKAFVLSFSEALAEELKGTGVTVTSLCPGPTETGFARNAGRDEARTLPQPAMSARSVAKTGFSALMRGDRLAVPGWGNLIMTSLIRFMPRLLVARVAKQTMRRKLELHTNLHAKSA